MRKLILCYLLLLATFLSAELQAEIQKHTILSDSVTIAVEESDSTELSSGSPEEQYDSAYMDSLWAARYPKPIVKRSTYNENISGWSSPVRSSNEEDNGITSIALDYTKKVGQIPIKSGIALSGAKAYEIPIDAYPGIKNFNPQLALVYNSHQGNSILGVGWSLSGLSSITRGIKTKIIDGNPEGISNTTNDAFYLDGERLIKLSEANDYILYESERGNIKVKGYVTGNVTKYFEVFYPDGSKGIFGYSSNSATNYLSYPIVLLSDIDGNAINYTYDFYGNHYSIKSIEYNGGYIGFQYISRENNLSQYKGGYHVTESKLLSRIECQYEDESLGVYTLSYSYNDYFPLLSTLNYSANGESLNPLLFYYDEVSGDISFSQSKVSLMEWYDFSSAGQIKTVRGKFDYISGEEGLIVYPMSNPYLHRTRNSNTDVFQNLYGESESIFVYTNLSGSTAVTKGELMTGNGFIEMLCADLQGTQEENIIKINNYVNSGKDRLVFSVYSSSVMSDLSLRYTRTYDFSTVYEDGEENKSIQPKFYYTGDFNGDGKMEIMAMSVHEPFGDTSKPSICYIFDLENNNILYQSHILDYNLEFVGDEQTDAQEAANNSDKLLVLDADGDGKTDICHIDASGIHVYTFTVSGSTMSIKTLFTSAALKKTSLRYKNVLLGEMNGDGLADLVITPSCYNSGDNIWTVYNSTGRGISSASTFNAAYNSTFSSIGFMLQDVNMDGLSDIIRYQSGSAHIHIVRNNVSDTIKTTISTAGINDVAKLIPLNVSSRNIYTSLLALNDSIITRISSDRHYAEESLIRGMANSLGVVERNSYRKIDALGVEDGFYTIGIDAVYPYVSIREPISVISSVATYRNGTLAEKIDYSYTNAVIHRQGLGFCGFGSITSVDSNSRYKTLTYDPYKYGVLIKETTSGYETIYNYAMARRDNGTLKLYMTSKIEDDFLKETHTVRLIDYDEYLNPKYVAVYYPNGITTNTTNLYSNNTGVGNGYSIGFLYDQTHVTHRTGTQSLTERMFIPTHSSMRPNVKLLYKGESLTENNVFTYDSLGNVTTHKVTPYSSTVDQTTTFTYDSHGRLIKETNPLGLSSEYTYGTDGRMSSSKDKRGNATTYTYDSFGRETRVVYPDNTIKTVSYEWCNERSGELYAIVTTETGKPSIKVVYDAFNREVRRSDRRFDGTWRNIVTTYNSRGKIAQESLPYKGTNPSLWNTYSYDLHDRLISITEASGRTTTYAYDGTAVTTVEDGVSVTRDYDALGNLISVTDSLGTITYSLCADGLPASITAPGGVTTTFGYDNYRRRISLADPSHGTTAYEYDAAGNIKKETNARGQVTQYSYDRYNRVSYIIANDRHENYLYNDYDELIEIVPNDESYYYWYAYDNLGRLSATYGATEQYSLQKNFTYTQGNITSIVYRSSGAVLATEGRSYTYGHLVGMELDGGTTLYELFEENEFGYPTHICTGGVDRYYSYSTYGYPVTRRADKSNGSRIQQDVTSYAPATGNLSIRRDVVNGITENFYYDGMNRLVNDYYGNIVYDNKGNMTSKADVGTFGYSNTSKPYAITGATLTGSSIPEYTQTVNYTTFNRPSMISENGVVARLYYNHDGERIKMTVTKNGNRSLTRYYLKDCYERDIDSLNNVVERLYIGGDYYSAPFVLIKNSSGSRVCNILRDHLGSVRYVTDFNGTVLQEQSYDAWGRLRNPSTRTIYTAENMPELILGRGYTGHEHLPWFGLVNMNARLYDPMLCRFLSPDLFIQYPDLSQNFNRYLYAMNNPFRYTDESGEFLWLAIGALVGGALNLTFKALSGDIHNFWDGVAAFGIGAVAGTLGGAVGNLAFGIAGGAIAGGGGFVAGAVSGAAASAVSSPVLSGGNSLYFGDPFMSAREYAFSIVSGALIGGTTNGIVAKINGKNFWNGASTAPVAQSASPTGNLNNSGLVDKPTSQVSPQSAEMSEEAFRASIVGDVKESGEYTLYVGYDKEDLLTVRYVGITRREPEIRFSEHLRSGTERANLKYYIRIQNLSYIDARIMEQQYINFFKMQSQGGVLYNKINSVAPKYWNDLGIIKF